MEWPWPKSPNFVVDDESNRSSGCDCSSVSRPELTWTSTGTTGVPVVLLTSVEAGEAGLKSAMVLITRKKLVWRLLDKNYG